VAAVALEGAPISDRLRQAAAGAFDSWTAALAARLEEEGHTREVAEGLAVTILCALEGALVLARAQRSAEPVRAVSRGLAPLLRPV
jgi:TetR/AcrR family transcriptional repressor of lmrAB and yxaGH operons